MTMNNIKQLSLRNIKVIIALLIFVSIGAGVTYSATTYLYDSNIIGYDNSNSGLTSTDVQGALDELYNTCVNSTNCPDGYVCYEKINVLPMFEENAVRDDISSTYVTSSTGIDFSKISSDTNGKGIYLLSGTEQSGHPIYYYRGAVTNNNVLFANFCWKIVRTTETGGIKLIYNGSPNSGKCNNTTELTTQLSETSKFNNDSAGTSSTYCGYTYNINGTESSSTVKTVIDNWYASNMTSYTSYLEDTVWCNDRSPIGDHYFGFYYRFITPPSAVTPSLNCAQNSDKYTVSSSNGNGKLTYPVGLLTADEIAYAGAIYNSTTNTSFYLYTNQMILTITPTHFANGACYMMFLYNDGKLVFRESNTVEHAVRPAVSLKPGTTFSYGDGTANSPYVVATN